MEGLRCGSYKYLVLFNLQRRGCDPQVYLLDHLSALVLPTNEKTSPQTPSWPLLPNCFSPVVIPPKTAKCGPNCGLVGTREAGEGRITNADV